MSRLQQYKFKYIPGSTVYIQLKKVSNFDQPPPADLRSHVTPATLHRSSSSRLGSSTEGPAENSRHAVTTQKMRVEYASGLG